LVDIDIYLYFLRHAISPGGNMTGVWKYSDSCADLALVYSDEDRDLFSLCYGYQTDQIKVVGNYNLDDLYTLSAEKNQNTKVKDANKNVVYIENGFSDPKYPIPGWTEDLVADEVENLADVCADYEYKLIIKLHPSSDYSILLERLAKHKNIQVMLHCDLDRLIANADVVIGQSSSVLMMAIAAGKILGILDIPPLGLQITTFLDREMGMPIRCIEDFRAILNKTKHKSIKPLKPNKIIDQFIGPFDGNATRRISETIILYSTKSK
jgi:CDP-glycerol glycerophosphotransferase (TagB/SpsB family)